MNQKVKFYRMSQLPQEGDVGGIYFITGEVPAIWLYTVTGWEQYTQIRSGLSVEDLHTLIIDDLITDDKSIVGSINELKNIIDQYINSLYSRIEVSIEVINSHPEPQHPYSGTQATLYDITTGDKQYQTIDEYGHCSFQILKGNTYKVSLDDVPQYYRVITNPNRTASLSNETYNIEVQYCSDERFIVLSNGKLYTWTEHQTSGSFPSGTTPKFLRVGNSVLEENNGVFYLPIERMQKVLTITPNWGSVNDDDVPELVNAISYSTNTGEYDMERNTTIINNFYKLDNIAAYIATQETMTVNGITFHGWLGTAEQYQQLIALNSSIQGWLEITGLDKQYFTTGLAGWTSSEYQNTSGNVRARIIVTGQLQASPKVRSNAGISVLPFYKNIHKL